MKLYPLQDYHRLKCPSPALTMTFNKPTVQYPYQDPYGNIMETQSIPFHREGPLCSSLTKPTSHPNPDPDPGNH